MSSTSRIRRHALAFGLSMAAFAGAALPAASVAQSAASSTVAAASSTQKMIPPLLIKAKPRTVGAEQPVVLTVTVQNPDNLAAKPTGVINFFDGSTYVGSAPLKRWKAKLSIATMSVGQHSMSAEYDGDANYEGTESSGITVTVLP